MVVFLDRDIERIVPTADRPLGNSRDAIEKRYRERYPIYCAAADIRVESNNDVETVADEVMKEFDAFGGKEKA